VEGLGEGGLKGCMHSLSFPFSGKHLMFLKYNENKKQNTCKIKKNSCKGYYKIAEDLHVERSAVLNILCVDIISLPTQHNTSSHYSDDIILSWMSYICRTLVS